MPSTTPAKQTPRPAFQVLADAKIHVQPLPRSAGHFNDWLRMTIAAPNGAQVKVEAVIYDEPSHYGIRNGRISKLWMSQDGREVLNYDRGWDVRPRTEEAKAILAVLQTLFPERAEA